MTTGRTITGKIIDETILEITTGKVIDGIIMESKCIEIGVKVEVGIVIEIITEIVQEKDLREVGTLLEIEVGKDKHTHVTLPSSYLTLKVYDKSGSMYLCIGSG